MKCLKCGSLNDSECKFCSNCGNPLPEVNGKQITNKLKKMSMISLLFLIFQFLIPFLFRWLNIICSLFTEFKILSNLMDFIIYFPWALVSLVLAIISRSLYKDQLSLIVLIIDLVLLFLAITTFIFFAAFINWVSVGCPS